MIYIYIIILYYIILYYIILYCIILYKHIEYGGHSEVIQRSFRFEPQCWHWRPDIIFDLGDGLELSIGAEEPPIERAMPRPGNAILAEPLTTSYVTLCNYVSSYMTDTIFVSRDLGNTWKLEKSCVHCETVRDCPHVDSCRNTRAQQL